MERRLTLSGDRFVTRNWPYKRRPVPHGPRKYPCAEVVGHYLDTLISAESLLDALYVDACWDTLGTNIYVRTEICWKEEQLEDWHNHFVRICGPNLPSRHLGGNIPLWSWSVED